jgi:transposase IS481 family protein
MDNHKNTHLTPKGRETMVRSVVEGGLAKASPRCSSAKTFARCGKRLREEGVDGLRDRSSRLFSLPSVPLRRGPSCADAGERKDIVV